MWSTLKNFPEASLPDKKFSISQRGTLFLDIILNLQMSVTKLAKEIEDRSRIADSQET